MLKNRVTISVSISAETLEKINNLAAAEDITRSAAIERCLVAGLHATAPKKGGKK